MNKKDNNKPFLDTVRDSLISQCSEHIENIDDCVEEIYEELVDIHKAAMEGNFEQVKK